MNFLQKIFGYKSDDRTKSKPAEPPKPAEIPNPAEPPKPAEIPNPAEPPKPPEPWRKLNIKDASTLKRKIEHFAPPSTEIPQARILMIGQIGAGKSSFCNTICSIFTGEITNLCPCGSANKSFTSVYRQYNLRSNITKNSLKFCFCDTRGIEDGEGPFLEDIKYLLDGSVPDEYKFNESEPINQNIQDFRKRPGLVDQVHCVAFVIDGSKVNLVNDAVWEKFKNVQYEICKRGIPRVVLLTKVDKICTTGDISKVFENREVLKAVDKVAEMLGVLQNNVHPIKNYDKEMKVNDVVDRLSLIALEQMTTLCSDFLENKCLTLSRIKPWRQQKEVLNKEIMQTLMDKIMRYTPHSDLGIPFARILLIGPKEAGKSSFLNTINSVFSGRITQQIMDGGTTMYRQYQIQTHMTGTALKFRLCDTCGVENKPSSYVTDLMYIVNGNVPDRYKLNSSSSINPGIPGFKKHPRLRDRVHCVVFVFDASKIDTIAESIWEKMNDLQFQINSLGLPRVVLLTQIDQLSQPLKDDLSKVFASVDVGDAVQKVVKRICVPTNKIHPIKNYEQEMFLDDNINTLSLLALDQILGSADDYLSSQRNNNDEKDNSIFFLLIGFVLLVALAILISKLFWF